ncbi:MAG: glycosyltransferase [Flavobacteriales bacterium]|nr:glycosyltransferase [Flavobacteriales bacterium]
MRIGVNPEKYKKLQNTNFRHRIIVVCYIPNTSEDYYTQSDQILDHCISSIVKTINKTTTAITLVLNQSCKEVDLIVQKHQKSLDKLVYFSENKGKVYAVLSEARASYEKLITITDCDVLFLPNWEKKMVDVFKTYQYAGVVAPLPMPNLAYKHNTSFFVKKLMSYKYQKIVSEKDCDLYLQGMGNSSLLNRNNRKHNWREKHFFLKHKNVIALAGAGHFVATYKREIFEQNNLFPKIKFENGLEDLFIDKPSDQLGWYRLSLTEVYAYHMGNRLDDFIQNSIGLESTEFAKTEDFEAISHDIFILSKILYPVRLFVFKLLHRIKWI